MALKQGATAEISDLSPGPQFGLAMPQAGSIASPDSLTRAARRGEELGYDSLWLGDHIVVPEELDSTYPYGEFTAASRANYFEPLGTLAYLSGITERIRLGLSVLIIPLRHPVFVAKQLATIDALAGGRVILGAGAGWLQGEFRALGLDENAFKQRGSMMEECLSLYRELWSNNETSSFEGRFFKLEPVRSYPKPAQPAGPPIWIGGNSRKATERAARYDGWMALRVGVSEFEESVTRIRGQRSESGAAGTFTFALRAPLGPGSGRSEKDQPASELVGDPSTVVENLIRYVESGCSHFIIDPQQWPPRDLEAYLETAEWFMQEVRPLIPLPQT